MREPKIPAGQIHCIPWPRRYSFAARACRARLVRRRKAEIRSPRWTPEAMMQYHRLLQAAVSPEGKWVADTVSVPVMHGEKEVRVPLSQGREFYNALKQQDCPAQLVIYPLCEHLRNLRSAFSYATVCLAAMTPERVFRHLVRISACVASAIGDGCNL